MDAVADGLVGPVGDAGGVPKDRGDVAGAVSGSGRATARLRRSTGIALRLDGERLADADHRGCHSLGRGAWATIVVTATDAAASAGGICRVVVAYTDGQGEWESVDLDPSDGDTWQGTLPLGRDVEYFVQVVDEAGNVSVDDNGGRYYPIIVPPQDHFIYLPVVLRSSHP